MSKVEYGSEFVLTARQELETKAAAYEGALFYSFAKSRAEQGRGIIVIGNKRYGHDFVVEPLSPRLEALGITTASGRVNSSAILPGSIADDNLMSDLASKRLDIIIVDGTTLPYLPPGKLRLPRSMVAYLNWVIAYNQAMGIKTDGIPERHEAGLRGRTQFEQAVQIARNNRADFPYKVRHWSPMHVEEVTFGGIVTQQYGYPDADPDPQIIFACPTVFPGALSSFPQEFRGHEPAFFDYLETDGNGRNDPRVPFFQEHVRRHLTAMLEPVVFTVGK